MSDKISEQRPMTEYEQGYAKGVCTTSMSPTCPITPWNDYLGCGACILIDANGLTPCRHGWIAPLVPQTFTVERP